MSRFGKTRHGGLLAGTDRESSLGTVLKALAMAAGMRKLVGVAWLASRALASRRARAAAASDRYRRYADREERRERFHRYADRELARERMARQELRAA